jgi:hypothetical protein
VVVADHGIPLRSSPDADPQCVRSPSTRSTPASRSASRPLARQLPIGYFALPIGN